MPIINSVIKGAGGGQTVTCLDRSAGSAVDDKVLINPYSEDPVGSMIPSDINVSSWTYYREASASSSTTNAGSLYNTYFSATNTLYGGRDAYREVQSNVPQVPWITYDDETGQFTSNKTAFPIAAQGTGSYYKIQSNGFYNISLYFVSSTNIGMTYYNTVTEQYVFANVTTDVNVSTTSSVGACWSYDGKYLFLYHPNATGTTNRFDVFQVNKDNSTGEITLTLVVSDDGTVITETPSSTNYLLSSIDDYSFIVSAGSWGSNLGSSTTRKIYQFDPATSTISLKRSFTGSDTSNHDISLLADSWFVGRNLSTAPYLCCYKWNGSSYVYDTDIGDIGNYVGAGTSTFYSYMFYVGRQFGCTKIFSNRKLCDFGAQLPSSTQKPTFLYIDNPSNPSSITILQDDRLTLTAIPFKDMIENNGRIIFKNGAFVNDTFPYLLPDLNQFIRSYIVDEYNNRLIMVYQAGTLYYFNMGEKSYYKSVAPSSYTTYTPFNFMNKGANTILGVYGSGTSYAFCGNNSTSYSWKFFLSSANDIYNLSPESGYSSMVWQAIFTDDLLIYAYPYNTNAYKTTLCKTNNFGITDPITIVLQSGSGESSYTQPYCLPNSDETKLYKIPALGSSSSVTVSVGTIANDYSSVSWDSTETWTLTDTAKNFFYNYIRYKSNFQLKDNTKVFVSRAGYVVMDDVNKTLTGYSFPSTVTDQIGADTIKDIQVFYDHKISFVTQRGNYLFSYTDGDLSTLTFESLLPNKSYGFYESGIVSGYFADFQSPGPYYSVYRTYAVEAIATQGLSWYQQIYKLSFNNNERVAYNKGATSLYTPDSITGKVKSLDNVNNTLTAEVVL